MVENLITSQNGRRVPRTVDYFQLKCLIDLLGMTGQTIDKQVKIKKLKNWKIEKLKNFQTTWVNMQRIIIHDFTHVYIKKWGAPNLN